VTLHTSLSGVICHACTHSYSICINQHTIFEVPSFTNSNDMIGAKLKKTGHVTLTTLIRE